ncbi:MAG: GumC domain-containing protein [Planctomycetota bacterium]
MSKPAEVQLEPFTRDGFDIYKNTHAHLFKSRYVLMAALRKPEVSKLKTVRERNDPIMWLQNQLQVGFPGDAEILKVSLAGDDPKEVATVLNAVVDAYMSEVVDAERKRRNDRLNELDNVYVDKEEEVRVKMRELRLVAEALGTGNPEALKLKQQIALGRFGDVQAEHFRTQSALRRAQGELKVRRALLQEVDKLEISQIEVDVFSQSDPVAAHLFQHLLALKNKLADIEASETPAPSAEKLRGRLEAVQEELNARQTQLRQLMRQKRRTDIEVEIRRGEVEVEVLADQQQQLAEDVKKLEKATERLAVSSVDLEMVRREIQATQQVLYDVAVEREKARIELRSAPRVQLIQRAEVPK